jgi:hypothetical protein
MKWLINTRTRPTWGHVPSSCRRVATPLQNPAYTVPMKWLINTRTRPTWSHVPSSCRRVATPLPNPAYSTNEMDYQYADAAYVEPRALLVPPCCHATPKSCLHSTNQMAYQYIIVKIFSFLYYIARLFLFADSWLTIPIDNLILRI